MSQLLVCLWLQNIDIGNGDKIILDNKKTAKWKVPFLACKLTIFKVTEDKWGAWIIFSRPWYQLMEYNFLKDILLGTLTVIL